MAEITTFGWIGNLDDPGLQFAIESLSGSDDQIVRIRDVARAASKLDHILVMDAHSLIANSSYLIQFDGKISVVLRRRGEQSELEWENAYQLIARVLPEFGNCDLDVFALTPTASKEIGDLIGIPVKTLDPVLRSDGIPGAFGKLTEFGEIIEIRRPDGSVRMLRAHARNWIRLRQCVMLDIDDASAPDLHDIVECANADPEPHQVPVRPSMPAVLFVVPNGVGLGHLTRLMAVAAELRKSKGAEVTFWCYSHAAYILARSGYAVVHRRTHAHLQSGRDAWNRWESLDLVRVVRRINAAAVVYDGAVISDALTEALKLPRMAGCGLIWVRRSMWHKRYKTSYLEMAEYCDLIIEPGDLASSADDGPTVTYEPKHLGLSRFVKTSPVIGMSRTDLLPRAQARRELKLPRFGPICALSLGGDAFESHAEVIDHVLRLAKLARVRIVMVRSPLSNLRPELAGRISEVSIYPLAKYLNAFDGIVCAAGYNSFHESLYLTDLPIVFSPTIHERLDNQSARAEFAESVGWARCVKSSEFEEAGPKLQEFFAEVRKGKAVARNLPEPEGSREIADQILDCLRRGPTDFDKWTEK